MEHGKKIRTILLICAALLLAVTTSASAATKIGGNQIKKNAIAAKHIKKNAVASSEIKKNAVGSGEIKKNAVGSGEIKKNAVGSGEIKNETITSADIAAGAQGYEVSTFHYDNVGAGNLATVACSAGKVAVGGGHWFNTAGDDNFDFAHPAITNGSGIIASFPGRIDFDGVDDIPNTPDDNTVIPGDNSGWVVQLNSRPGQEDDDPEEEFSQEMTLYVICVNP